MATETDHPEQQQPKQLSLEVQPAEAKVASNRMVSEAYAQAKDNSDLQKASTKADAGAGKKTDTATLPSLSLNTGPEFVPLPWESPITPDGKKLHMNYELHKDTIVKLKEGPFHVAERVLGKGAKSSDIQLLTNAMRDQYAEEKQDPGAIKSLALGHRLIDENNIEQIMNRISDPAARHRIEDRLKEGWTDKALPTAVPFDHDARPGETQPSSIEDSKTFLKDLAAAAIDVGAEALRAKGQCAAGARLAFNELPLWHIDGGAVDRSINKDPNGWRGGVKMAQDLGGSGLFDVVPLSKIGVDNLKEGYIVGRFHHPEYVKQHPTWEGEDLGDIDIVTKKQQPQDDGKFYVNSFVLIPKENKAGS